MFEFRLKIYPARANFGPRGLKHLTLLFDFINAFDTLLALLKLLTPLFVCNDVKTAGFPTLL